MTKEGQATSEIRDKVRKEIINELRVASYEIRNIQTAVDRILTIPELAIVDREAELPQNQIITSVFTDNVKKPFERNKQTQSFIEQAYIVAQEDMLEAGWVKEIK